MFGGSGGARRGDDGGAGGAAGLPRLDTQFAFAAERRSAWPGCSGPGWEPVPGASDGVYCCVTVTRILTGYEVLHANTPVQRTPAGSRVHQPQSSSQLQTPP